MAENVIGPQTQVQPRVRPAPRVAEGPLMNRGAVAATGFVAGWTPVICCSIGVVPAILSGLGLGTAFFALGKTILWGFGWEPILVLGSAVMIFGMSFLITRPVFANFPREVAVQHFWRTVGFTALAAGIVFILWMEVVMPLLFVFNVPMGALQRMHS